MSGKILIVDDLATNRIVLKVKLSEAFYEVIQASSGAEALKIAVEKPPDLILSNAHLSDMDGASLTKALRAQAESADIPVVLIFDTASDPDKLPALMAGANEVLIRPVNESMLLARLRSLLRQRHSNQDLQLHVGTACTLGFAEAQQGFQAAGRVALVASRKSDAIGLQAALSPHSSDIFIPLTTAQAAGPPGNRARPDIFVLEFVHSGLKAGLQLMAELRASPKTRHCPVIVLLGECDSSLQATILDMGANDVVCGAVEPSELALRISAQLRNKRQADLMRNQLQDGLKAAVIDPLTGLYNRRYALPYLTPVHHPGPALNPGAGDHQHRCGNGAEPEQRHIAQRRGLA